MRKFEDDKLSNIFEPCYGSHLDIEELKSCLEAKKRQTLGAEVQKTLKQEILHLQKQLDDQFFERSALEKALTNQPLCHNTMDKNSISKPVEDLIKEISVLELEVVYLEKYLLSLYRKRFQEKSSIFSEPDQSRKSNTTAEKWIFSEFQGHGISTNNENSRKLTQDLLHFPLKESAEFSSRDTILDSNTHRSYSSLSHRSDHALRISYPAGILSEAVNSYHSLPLSMLEHAQCDYTSNSTTLVEHFSKNLDDGVVKSPSWISEELIKSISSIYIELAEPPLAKNDYFSSPISFPSPISDFSPNKWSPEEKRNTNFTSWANNPFDIEKSKEFNGSYTSVVEVKSICRDSGRLKRVKHTLQRFRSLVSRLEKVNPKKMKHEEKLAFWINVHNALVMHAYLVYGISHNSMKRISLILKAAYNVGGHTMSLDMIQSSILGCRLPRPGQWLHSLFFPRTKFKVKDARRNYAVEHPDSRVYFALCSGSYSDPAVRVYTPKRIYQDLEAAKEDYIQTTLRVNKDSKIALPKLVDLFVKESSLCPYDFMELFGHLIPHNSLRNSLQQNLNTKFWKKIEWVPHDFSFRFLISKELVSL